MVESPASRILAVDDEPYVLQVLERWLDESGFEIDTAADAESALDKLAAAGYDLLLLDIKLPGISGLDLLRRVRGEHNDIAVIMVTGVDDRATALEALDLGAYSYIIKPFEQGEVLVNVAGALRERARIRESIDTQTSLRMQVRESTAVVRSREEEIALRLIAAAEFRDEESSAHIRRIGMFAEAMARALGWAHEDVETIRVAGAMHDIGKIGIPDGILLKPRKLTPQEFEVIKTHTTNGARMLAGSEIPILQMAEEVALSHHECWDGSGYPRGLMGEDIPESGRIVKIADVYDSLTHPRHYRPAFDHDEALAMMTEDRRRQFDPRLFEVFIDALPAFDRIRRKVADEMP